MLKKCVNALFPALWGILLTTAPALGQSPMGARASGMAGADLPISQSKIIFHAEKMRQCSISRPLGHLAHDCSGFGPKPYGSACLRDGRRRSSDLSVKNNISC